MTAPCYELLIPPTRRSQLCHYDDDDDDDDADDKDDEDDDDCDDCESGLILIEMSPYIPTRMYRYYEHMMTLCWS